MSSIEKQLRTWGEQYGVDASLIGFTGYVLKGESMGSAKGYSDGRAEIALHRKLEGHPIASEIVLWHEFCHAWTWQELGIMGHGPEFIKRDLRRPLNFILGIIPALIVLF